MGEIGEENKTPEQPGIGEGWAGDVVAGGFGDAGLAVGGEDEAVWDGLLGWLAGGVVGEAG